MTQDTSLAGLDLDLVRSRFPALASDWTFFDNGGGSQILGTVLDRMRDFLVTSNVQLGASYDVSLIASERLSAAHAAVATLVNAASPDEVIMGPSTTALLRTLSQSVGGSLGPGDEIIVTTGDHEANIGPWLELERAGATIRFWEVDSDSGELVVEDLTPLLGPRTKLVAMTHASNILGTINPVRQIADLVHEHGAWLCVDGVGFAPHRAVDVRALDADFYAFSFYKTFGPHHAVLYGKLDLLRELPGHGFYFISEEDVPYKFQPGNVNYELSYSLLGLLDYLTEIGDGSVTKAFDRIALHEEALSARLLDFLATKPGVRVVGSPSADLSVRVPILSFLSDRTGSRAIVEATDPHRIGIRHGHFYSSRLIEALGLPLEDGVVRVSMVHYNTVEEVDRLIDVLDPLL